MRKHTRHRIASLAVTSVLVITAQAAAQVLPGAVQPSSTTVRLEVVAQGLVAPNLLVGAGDGSGRRFIVDQPGQVHVLDAGGTLLATPFLDVSSDIGTLRHAFTGQNPGTGLNTGFDERGLLGLAFHTDFANPLADGFGKVYTYHSEDDQGLTPDFTTVAGTPNHHSVVTEWMVDPNNPNVVDPASRRTLLRVAQPQFNHNAGMIAFDSAGLLHIALGDGGGANDTATGHTPGLGNGQDRTNPLGSLLRIDPLGSNSANGEYDIPGSNPFVGNVDGFVEEIYSWGLRNPFRFSIDGDDIIIADVGQNVVEEVNFQSLAAASGANYGWNVKEGSFYFDPNDPGTVSPTPIPGVTPGGFTSVDPELEYDHTEGVSVIGGYVYHAGAVPEIDGNYIFGEFNGRLFAGDFSAGTIEELKIIGDLGTGIFADIGLNIKGFGIDDDGEIYILAGVNQGPSGTLGRVIKIIPIPEPATGLLVMGLACIGLARRQRTALRRN